MTDHEESRHHSDGSAEAERLARPLRAPERLPADFEERVMAIARHEAPTLYPRRGPGGPGEGSWWIRRRTLALSPLAGLAIAASFAGIVALGTLALAAGARAPAARVADSTARDSVHGTVHGTVHDTVHVVRFVFVGQAHQVALVGDFNGWSKDATPLERGGRPGIWTASVALPAGRHEYAFIVDGEHWTADPLAAPNADEFGTESSVLTVGVRGSSAS
jgi:hypothetical protein